MEIIHNYSQALNNKGITFKLVKFIPEKNEWKYQLACKRPINDAEELDHLFKDFYRFIGDMILDGYDVEIAEEFNFLIRKPA